MPAACAASSAVIGRPPRDPADVQPVSITADVHRGVFGGDALALVRGPGLGRGGRQPIPYPVPVPAQLHDGLRFAACFVVGLVFVYAVRVGPVRLQVGMLAPPCGHVVNVVDVGGGFPRLHLVRDDLPLSLTGRGSLLLPLIAESLVGLTLPVPVPVRLSGAAGLPAGLPVLQHFAGRRIVLRVVLQRLPPGVVISDHRLVLLPVFPRRLDALVGHGRDWCGTLDHFYGPLPPSHVSYRLPRRDGQPTAGPAIPRTVRPRGRLSPQRT